MKPVLDQLLSHIEREHAILGNEEYDRRWKPMIELFKRDIHDLLTTGYITREEAVEAQMALIRTIPEEPVFPTQQPAPFNP